MAGKEAKDKTSGSRLSGSEFVRHRCPHRSGIGVSLVCGLSDGSVSAFNIVLWLPLLVGVGDGTRRWPELDAYGQRRLANGVLLALALPTTLIGLFFLAVIIL